MRNAFGILLVATLFMPVFTSDARANNETLPRVVVLNTDPERGTPSYKTMKRFGNKKRIDRLSVTAPSSERTFVIVRDRAGRPDFKKVRRFGNKNRIAKLSDASVKDNSGRVIILSDAAGSPELKAIKRFGNKNRIEKRTGTTRR